jgi:hypothetical protein
LVVLPDSEPEHNRIPTARLRDARFHQAAAHTEPVAAAIDVDPLQLDGGGRDDPVTSGAPAEPSRTR